jgi:hypothetical protein
MRKPLCIVCKLAGIVLLFCVNVLHAQQPKTIWSEEDEISRKERVIALVGRDSTGYYVYSDQFGKRGKYQLTKLDKSGMKEVYSINNTLPKISAVDPEFLDLIVWKERLLLITTAYEKDQSSLKAYGTFLNAFGEVVDFPVLLDEIKDIRYKSESTFQIELSPDSSLMMIQHDSSTLRKSSESFSFKVYDTSLELQWQKDLELPFQNDVLAIESFLVANNGHVYMMSGTDKPKKERNVTNLASKQKKYLLLSYDPELNKVKEYDVSLRDKWIISATFDLAPNGDVVMGGFYSNDKFFSIAGTFFFKISGTDKKVEASGLMAFDRHFLKQFMNEKRVERGRELNNFYFDHFLVREDGSATLVAEQYYVIERYLQDPSTGRYQEQNYYYYNDLIVVDVNPDATINWAIKVPKKQVSINDNGPYSSYALAWDEQHVHIVFNDDSDNTAIFNSNPDAEMQTMSNIKKSTATWVAVGRDGSLSRSTLFNAKDATTLLRPKIYLGSRNAELVLYAQYRKKYRFGLINFDL